MASPQKDIAVLIGSLRRDSINKKAALALDHLAPDSLRLSQVDIATLDYYNQDFDADPAETPITYRAFRERIARADGVLFLTPEYNRTIPAVIKNAVDVGSRPYGKSVWAGKPAGVISMTMGVLGGFGANQDLRRLLGNMDMRVMQQPEVYLSSAHEIFGAEGVIDKESTRTFLKSFIDAFATWVQHHPALAA